MNTNDSGITVIESRIQEQPIRFQFRKQDVMGMHPTMANLDYDPFPDAGPNDVVREEIIGRQLVLHAKCRGPGDSLRPGLTVNADGRPFALTEVAEAPSLQDGPSTFVIEGVYQENDADPLKVLAQLRARLAMKP
jgi:hypothetical protein